MSAREDEARAAREPGPGREPVTGEPEPPAALPKVRVAGRTGAVALRYHKDEDAAPSIVAKGQGEVAERILELAREHGVPVRKDKDLLQLLSACEVGDSIPAELYAAVAEILAFLYRLNGELGGERQRAV
jgi:flagellar biosynthesis protein